MAKFSLKSKIMIALPVFMLVTGIPIVTLLYAQQPSVAEAQTEHDELKKVVQKMQSHIKSTQHLAQSFFSIDNHGSISWFIQQLTQEEQGIDGILAQLRQSREAHSQGTIVNKMLLLFDDLRGNVELLKRALQQNCTPKSAMSLIPPLQQLQSDIAPRIERIMGQFRGLHTQVMMYNSQIAQNIAVFMNEFYNSVNQQKGKAEILKGLMHRVRCNKR